MRMRRAVPMLTIAALTSSFLAGGGPAHAKDPTTVVVTADQFAGIPSGTTIRLVAVEGGFAVLYEGAADGGFTLDYELGGSSVRLVQTQADGGFTLDYELGYLTARIAAGNADGGFTLDYELGTGNVRVEAEDADGVVVCDLWED